MSDVGFRPLGDRVLVKRIEAQETSKGGIIIPDAARERPGEGTVIAVGNGQRMTNGEINKPDVKVGDRVMFGRYVGLEIKVDGVEHVILNEGEILGVVLNNK